MPDDTSGQGCSWNRRPNEAPLDDEIDRLIRRFGSKTALIEEIRRRRGRRGAKPHKDLPHLLEMARLVERARIQRKGDPQLGRAAGIIADRQNRKPGRERQAVVKRWKRKFLKFEHILLVMNALSDSTDYMDEAKQLLLNTEIPRHEKLLPIINLLHDALDHLDSAIRRSKLIASSGHNSTNYVRL